MANPRSDYISILEGKVRLYRRNGSSKWQARFNNGPRQYVRRSLDTDDLEKAKHEALMHFAKMGARKELGRPVVAVTFEKAAQEAVKKLEAHKNIEGRTSLRDYKLVIENALIPYFEEKGPELLEAITEDDLVAFIDWRASEIGHAPSPSTVANYIGGMRWIWSNAVKEKWIKDTDVPKFPRRKGKPRSRPYLEETEYERIEKYLHKFILKGKRKISRVIRNDFVAMLPVLRHTGMRPGTEVLSLKWGSFSTFKAKDGAEFIVIKVLSGKRGPREVVCGPEIVAPLMDFQRYQIDYGEKTVFPVPFDHELYDKPIFNRGLKLDKKGNPLKDVHGELKWLMTNQSEYSRAFAKLLSDLKIRLDLKKASRSLYSLRHLYITERLGLGISSDILATQCGTSVMVIDSYYKKLMSRRNAADLAEQVNMKDVKAKNEQTMDRVSTFGAMELLRAVFKNSPKNKAKPRAAT